MTLKGGGRHRRRNQISSFLKTCRAAALEKSFLCITSDKICASSRLMCHGSVCQQSNIHVFVPGRPKIVLQKIRFDESCWGALLMNRIFILMLDASSRLESAQDKKCTSVESESCLVTSGRRAQPTSISELFC